MLYSQAVTLTRDILGESHVFQEILDVLGKVVVVWTSMKNAMRSGMHTHTPYKCSTTGMQIGGEGGRNSTYNWVIAIAGFPMQLKCD